MTTAFPEATLLASVLGQFVAACDFGKKSREHHRWIFRKFAAFIGNEQPSLGDLTPENIAAFQAAMEASLKKSTAVQGARLLRRLLTYGETGRLQLISFPTKGQTLLLPPCEQPPDKKSRTLKRLLRDYLAYTALSAGSSHWYCRAVSVFCKWHRSSDVHLDYFNGEAITRFLMAKEQEGRKSSYLKSLRGGLVALLRYLRGAAGVEPVRRIVVERPMPKAWTLEEVERLLEACESLPLERDRVTWLLIVGLGYYTGLNFCDIERIEQKDISNDCVLVMRRRKTGNLVVVALPEEIVNTIRRRCQAKGPIVRVECSGEWFRQKFSKLVKQAGISPGTFKTLRKTSGSLTELEHPGTGHKHLGNSRTIFERHYESLLITRSKATEAPPVKMPEMNTIVVDVPTAEPLRLEYAGAPAWEREAEVAPELAWL